MNDGIELFTEWKHGVLQEGLPDQLFHYTDAHGALGILQNSEIWLSHARFSNDKEEIKYAVQLAQDVVKETYEDLKDTPNAVVDTPFSWFLERLMRFLDKRDYSRDVFICCFCENKDLLSQWRAYAGKAGFSLGFESKVLLNLAKNIYPNADVFFSRVVYDPDSWKQLILNALERCRVDLEKVSSVYADGVNDAIFRIALKFRDDVMLLAPFLKHPGFVEEQEWRLCVAYNLSMVKPEFRVGRTGIMPFLKSSSLNCIREVVIGPTDERDLTFHALKLMNIEFEFDICPSKVPLR